MTIPSRPQYESRRTTSQATFPEAAPPLPQTSDRSQGSTRKQSLTGSSEAHTPAGRSTIMRTASRTSSSRRASETSAAASDKYQTRRASSHGFSEGSEQLGAVQESADISLLDRGPPNGRAQSRPSSGGLEHAISLSSLDSNEKSQSILAQIDQLEDTESASFPAAESNTQFQGHQAGLEQEGLAQAFACRHERYPEDDMGCSMDTTIPQQQLQWTAASHRLSQPIADLPSRGVSKRTSNDQQVLDLSLQKQVLSQNQLSISMPRPQTPDNSNQASHRPSDQAVSHSHSSTASERAAFTYHAGDCSWIIAGHAGDR